MTTYSSGHCGVADYVTGLQTRGDLESCLQVHLEQDGDQQPLLVALGVDVIGLKQINDTSGFLAGDKHLAAAAAKLVDATKLSHLQSRLGGDELAAIFLGTHALENATTAKEILLACPKAPNIRCGIAPAAAGDTAALLIERLYTAIRKA
ncbi:MAG: GGDEF domain-containing protein [Pirellulales bacterium]|jgi:diguanylate cyclase (GGDEF)-like protein